MCLGTWDAVHTAHLNKLLHVDGVHADGVHAEGFYSWASAGAKNKYLAYWSPLIATVALVTTGAEFTGPSMNPAFVSLILLQYIACRLVAPQR